MSAQTGQSDALLAERAEAVRAALACLSDHVSRAFEKRAGLGLPTCADALPPLRKLSALMEEVGEVAEAIQGCEGRERLRSELFDVATIAVLWAATVTDMDAGPWDEAA